MWRFNKKKKEDNEKMTTLEQVRKAYDDLSDDDKKSFHQSISDRVHESIGEQEHDDGDKDSQSAADREHEALGEEHADGEGDVSELHEEDDKKDEQGESKTEESKPERGDDKYDAILARLNALEARFHDETDKAESADEEAVKKAEEVYGLGNGVFTAAREAEKDITPQEAAKIARGLKL